MEQDLCDVERFIDTDGGSVNERDANVPLATQMLNFKMKAVAYILPWGHYISTKRSAFGGEVFYKENERNEKHRAQGNH